MGSYYSASPKTEGCQVHCVVSGKGGVGKTTAAIALAAHWALAKNGSEKVCLVDLDFFAPNCGVLARKSGDSRIFLNHYVWASYFKQLREAGQISDLRNAEEALEAYPFSVEQFKELSHKADLLDGLLQPSQLEALSVVSVAESLGLQNAMLPILDSTLSRAIFVDKLQDLFRSLAQRGYINIVLDSPAELKEVAISAIQAASGFHGSNIYVGNITPVTLAPLLRMRDIHKTDLRKKFVIVNRVRNLDTQFCSSRTAFLDYCLLIEHNMLGKDSGVSLSLIDDLTALDGCGYLPWRELFERLFAYGATLSNDILSQLSECIEKYCQAII